MPDARSTARWLATLPPVRVIVRLETLKALPNQYITAADLAMQGFIPQRERSTRQSDQPRRTRTAGSGGSVRKRLDSHRRRRTERRVLAR
jgi:hypothetical protein